MKVTTRGVLAGYPPRRSPCAIEGRAATPWITSTRQTFYAIVTGVSPLS